MEHAKSEKEREMSEEKQQYKDNRPVATCFDWELQQTILHINKAISVTDSARAHFLVSAKNIIQGVKER